MHSSEEYIAAHRWSTLEQQIGEVYKRHSPSVRRGVRKVRGVRRARRMMARINDRNVLITKARAEWHSADHRQSHRMLSKMLPEMLHAMLPTKTRIVFFIENIFSVKCR